MPKKTDNCMMKKKIKEKQMLLALQNLSKKIRPSLKRVGRC